MNRSFFCHILQTLREKTGYSLEQLARYLNIEPKTVQKWEGGSAEPSAPQYLLINKLFGLYPDDLNDEIISLIPEEMREEFCQEAWKNKLYWRAVS